MYIPYESEILQFLFTSLRDTEAVYTLIYLGDVYKIVFLICIGVSDLSIDLKMNKLCCEKVSSETYSAQRWNSSTVTLSQRSRCVSRQLLWLSSIIEEPKSPKFASSPSEKWKLEAGHTHIHRRTYAHSYASLVLHSFFTPQSVELCLQGPIFK